MKSSVGGHMYLHTLLSKMSILLSCNRELVACVKVVPDYLGNHLSYSYEPGVVKVNYLI